MVSFSSPFEYCEPLQRVAASAYATNISAPHCCISLSTDIDKTSSDSRRCNEEEIGETQKLAKVDKWWNNRVKK